MDASALAARGPFYSEDARAEFDVLDYNVETSFVPDRYWMEGRTRLKIRVRTVALSALTLRLADGLTVSSVTSDLHGRLLQIRVRNQNSVVVNLPEAVNRDDELTLTVSYAGRHEPQGLDRENLTVAAEDVDKEIEQFAQRAGRTPAAVRAQLEKEGGLGRLSAGLRREKAVDLALSRAKMTDT